MIERGDYLNPEGKKKTGFYPQIVRSQTVNTEALAASVARGKRFTTIETKATIEIILACIEDELLAGNSVCFDGFGTLCNWRISIFSGKDDRQLLSISACLFHPHVRIVVFGNQCQSLHSHDGTRGKRDSQAQFGAILQPRRLTRGNVCGHEFHSGKAQPAEYRGTSQPFGHRVRGNQTIGSIDTH